MLFPSILTKLAFCWTEFRCCCRDRKEQKSFSRKRDFNFPASSGKAFITIPTFFVAFRIFIKFRRQQKKAKDGWASKCCSRFETSKELWRQKWRRHFRRNCNWPKADADWSSQLGLIIITHLHYLPSTLDQSVVNQFFQPILLDHWRAEITLPRLVTAVRNL